MNYQFASRVTSLKPSAIREILKSSSDPETIPFSAGNPSPDAFPTEAILKITGDILQTEPTASLQYGITEGYTPLRDVLKQRLLEKHRIGTENDELIIVSGAQQGNQLVAKAFCNPGDTIICESPSFIGSLNAFKALEINLVGVPLQSDGIDVEKLEEAMKANPNAKVLYLIPNFQNPAGCTMSLAKRKAVYELAKKHGIIILEDNPYGDLRFAGEDIPSIKSMDTEGIVAYCGSFSKILAPGLRVGYLCAPQEVIAKATVLKQGIDVHSTLLAQMIAYRFMTECDFNAHIVRLQKLYGQKFQVMADAISQYFGENVTYTAPEGGLFFWCQLEEGKDATELAKKAVAEKVTIVPGMAFAIQPGDLKNCFRMTYATPTNEQILKGVQILGKLTKII